MLLILSEQICFKPIKIIVNIVLGKQMYYFWREVRWATNKKAFMSDNCSRVLLNRIINILLNVEWEPGKGKTYSFLAFE